MASIPILFMFGMLEMMSGWDRMMILSLSSTPWSFQTMFWIPVSGWRVYLEMKTIKRMTNLFMIKML